MSLLPALRGVGVFCYLGARGWNNRGHTAGVPCVELATRRSARQTYIAVFRIHNRDSDRNGQSEMDLSKNVPILC